MHNSVCKPREAEDVSIDDENKTVLKRKLEPRFFSIFADKKEKALVRA